MHACSAFIFFRSIYFRWCLGWIDRSDENSASIATECSRRITVGEM